MNPLGYLFTIGGIILIRQVVIGRATNLPSDTKDFSLALVQGDIQTASGVLARRGTTGAAPGEVATGNAAPVTTSSNGLVQECERLGNAAKGYRWGATGPDYYDCSGLVWRAMRNLNLYEGPRFPTQTFLAVARMKGWPPVKTPQAGDVILWPMHHMGVATSATTYYSAKDPAHGIKDSPIAGDVAYFGAQPVIVRVT